MRLTARDEDLVLLALSIAQVALRTRNDLCCIAGPCASCAERINLAAEYNALADRLRTSAADTTEGETHA
ncbi:MAG: hypothetical protein ACYCO9_16325 [Streptosporangiaceae bacterium]